MFSNESSKSNLPTQENNKLFHLSNFDRYRQLFTTIFFVCNSRFIISEKESQNLIFKMLLQSELHKRLAASDKFYDQFGCRNINLQQQVGLYAVESIDNPKIITVAFNIKKGTLNISTTKKLTKNIKVFEV